MQCSGSGKEALAEFGETIIPTTREGIARCPDCNRRLKVREKFCIGGEYIGSVIPPHKQRSFQKKVKRNKRRPRPRH